MSERERERERKRDRHRERQKEREGESEGENLNFKTAIFLAHLGWICTFLGDQLSRSRSECRVVPIRVLCWRLLLLWRAGAGTGAVLDCYPGDFGWPGVGHLGGFLQKDTSPSH